MASKAQLKAAAARLSRYMEYGTDSRELNVVFDRIIETGYGLPLLNLVMALIEAEVDGKSRAVAQCRADLHAHVLELLAPA